MTDVVRCASMLRPRREAWQRSGWRTVKGAICLQRVDEQRSVESTLGRPPTPPTQGPPRDLGTPLSRRPNPCPGRGSHCRGASAGDPIDPVAAKIHRRCFPAVLFDLILDLLPLVERARSSTT